jgi:hypothetical protein
MAALTKTDLTKRIPLGDRVLQSFRVTTGSADTGTEWIATGLSEIVAVVGVAVKGTSAITDTLAVAAPVASIDTFTAAVGNTSSIANGEILTIGSQVYTFVSALTETTAPVKATGTVTFVNAAHNVVNTDTVVINGRTYTFKDTPAAIDDIDVSTTDNTVAASFKNAINLDALPGATTYFDGTGINRDVVASGAANVITLTAIVPGTVGNVTLTAAVTNAGSIVVSGATLTGGLDAVVPAANEVLIGADDDATLANLRDAINGAATIGTDYSSNVQPNPVVTATLDVGGGGATASTLTLTARVPGTAANAIVFTTDATGVTVTGGGTLGGGTAGVDQTVSTAGGVGTNFVLNAQGTAVAAGTNMGDLGVECSQASKVIEVTVIGKP